MIKLLIVDDEPAIVKILEELLSEDGIYEIMTATWGGQAFEIIKTQKPRIVILDIMMPDGSGMDILSAIREFDPTMQVIMITILRDKSFERGAKKLGAHSFFVKPFDLEKFRNTVDDAAKFFQDSSSTSE